MSAGTWAQLTGVTDQVLRDGTSVTGEHLTYAFTGVWDPNGKKLYYVGAGHGVSDAPRLFIYDAETNAWTHPTSFGPPGPMTLSHNYDHESIDPVTRTLYIRNYGDNDGRIFQWPIATNGPLSLATSFPLLNYVQVAIGSTWFEGMRGYGSNGAYVIWSCGDNPGQILAWNRPSDTWTNNPVANPLTAANYHCFIEYSRVHNVAVFGGGGNTPQKIWRLDPNKSVTALPDAPIGLGIQAANLIADPNTGNFIVFGNFQLWELDPRGSGTWRQLPTPPAALGNPGSPDLSSVVSFAIPEYGVLIYVRCITTTECRHYLYKHGLPSLPLAPTNLIVQ